MTRQASRSWIALVSLSLTACVLDTKPGGDIVDDDSGSSEGSEGSESSASGSATSGTSEGASEGIIDDGCSVNADCNDPSMVCQAGFCIPASAPSCLPVGQPECGNGVLEVLEECDGVLDCDARCTTAQDGGYAAVFMAITDLALQPDGEYAALGFDPSLSSVQVVTSVEALTELNGTSIDQHITQPSSITTDPSGNIYAVGSRDDGAESVAVIVALDDQANELWTLDLGLGTALDVIADDSRIVVVGGRIEDFAEPEAVMWFIDPSGTLTDSPPPNDTSFISAIAPVGDDLVGATYPIIDASTITRWDAEGTVLWNEPVAAEPGEAASINAIAADGMGGTWAAGSTVGGPVALHHDVDGNVVERLDCIGGGTGSVQEIAVDDDGRLALGLSADSQDFGIVPWFAVVTGGVVTFGTLPGFGQVMPPNLQDGAPTGLQWMEDGSLLTVSVPVRGIRVDLGGLLQPLKRAVTSSEIVLIAQSGWALSAAEHAIRVYDPGGEPTETMTLTAP